MESRIVSSAAAPEQCVILLDGSAVYGAGGGRPMLADLLWQARRFGFRRVLLLAQGEAPPTANLALDPGWTDGLEVEIIACPGAGGACGALRQASGRLDRRFLLLGGGSVFDVNWLELQALSQTRPAAEVCMSLRRGEPADRHAKVVLDGETVTGLDGEAETGGVVSGGVYLVDRAVLERLPENGGFVQAALARLAAQGLVAGRLQQGAFRDGGAAGLASLKRGAVFFDRDGVLNVDHGYTHHWDRFEWIQGAMDAIKAVNDRNLFVFVVTNQSGVARGYYEEAAIEALHGRMQSALRDHGAHIDDIRYCPHHPEGVVERYAKACDWRKPGPGMILDLAAHWPVDLGASWLIGDNSGDMQAAAAAGVRGVMFEGGRLDRLVETLLDQASAPVMPE
jgi:D,D-heptose 1,7-bisphosphate phosphatase